MNRISPLAKSPGGVTTVNERYRQIVDFISAPNAPPDQRRELLGDSVVFAYPLHYYELAAMHGLALSPGEWATMTLEQRGEHVAYLRLKNMIDVIERHEGIQRKEVERIKANAGKQNGNKRRV